MKKSNTSLWLIFSVLLIAAVACSSGTGGATTTAQVGANAPVDPKAAVQSSMKKQMELPAYRGTIVGEYNGKTSTTTVEYSAPDRYHVKNDTVEAILIAKTTYIKLSGVWSKMNIDLTSMINSFRNPQLLQTGLTNIMYAGSESLNGTATDVYTFTSSADFNGSKLSANSKIWISRLDSLPAKMEVSAQVNSTSTLSTITYEYPTSISIEPPIK